MAAIALLSRPQACPGDDGFVGYGRQFCNIVGGFNAFPIQEDGHLLSVLRYIERNPVRAGLVERAEAWPWSSAAAWRERCPVVEASPVPRPGNWSQWVKGLAKLPGDFKA